MTVRNALRGETTSVGWHTVRPACVVLYSRLALAWVGGQREPFQWRSIPGMPTLSA
ncbi:hypothetical protein [Arthrobacter sp. fls2-241-R2A-172]|uniref:hypothetical protein n=1 Tax=Arthrobacter sp. fls2-241-R2A-172 TaxID=3040325 RepID=UPI00254A1C44|nr:hypothetical protein [Arthrobacter sp. fls2-241-R2A-172]